MSDNQPTPAPSLNAEQHTALFANLVLQQSNMAMMLMGITRAPGQEESMKDLEAARLFIDQLEMLEVKTRGNLNREESKLLGQTLMSLRLAFVEAVDQEPQAQSPAPAGTAPTAPAPEKPAAEAPAPDAQTSGESHKKFSKKY